MLNDGGKYVLQPDDEMISISVLPGWAFDKAALFSDAVHDRVCEALSSPTIYEAAEKARAEAEILRVSEEKARAENNRQKQSLRNLILHLREQGMTDAKIIEITGLTLDEINAIEKEI